MWEEEYSKWGRGGGGGGRENEENERGMVNEKVEKMVNEWVQVVQGAARETIGERKVLNKGKRGEKCLRP